MEAEISNVYDEPGSTNFGSFPTFSSSDIEAIRALPVVKQVAHATYDTQVGAAADLNLIVWRATASYFAVNNLPVAQGRLPTEADGPDAVVIGHAVAQRIFGERTPLGETIQSSPDAVLGSDLPPVALGGQRDSYVETPSQRYTVVSVL